MDITASIIAHLKADTAVAARVSDRIYRSDFPSFQQLPAIKVMKVDDLRGGDTSTGRYSTARVQCTAYAKTDAEADEVSELVADALHRTKNTVVGTVLIVYIDDAGTVPDNNPKIPLYLYHRDFMVEYSIKLTR